MVVDYSKWDKLELSDDSDIEVHPNVDKNSFIRWKQRDIYEKREQMKARIEYLKSCNEMNDGLIKRITQLIESSKDEVVLGDIQKSVSLACKGFKDSRPGESEGNEEGPKYGDMIESLLVQVNQEVERAGVSGASEKEKKTIEELNKHLGKLNKALELETKEYNDLVEERSRHIISDDIHTGFDSTLINKEIKNEGNKEVKETIEVINKGSSSGTSSGAPSGTSSSVPSSAPTSSPLSDNDVKASPDAIAFSNLPADNLQRLYSFLDSHPHIVKESEKDALMMVAFEQQLSKDPQQQAKMKNTVHNALLLQYCATLGPQGTRLFFSRISNKDHPALEAFKKDVDFTCNHIKQRCEILSSAPPEVEEEEVEQIQLHAVDPNTEIVITVPEADSPGRAIYNQLSSSLRKAIETKKLDEINKVLGDMTIEEAEKAVEDLNTSGVLSVEEKIYDVNEWQAEKEKILKEQTYNELEQKVFGDSLNPSSSSAQEDSNPQYFQANDEVD